MIPFLIATTTFALGTWVASWWAVALVAGIAGVMLRAQGGRPGLVALAASAAWGLLLVVDSIAGRFGYLDFILGGAMGLPGWLIVVLTLLFPALLAWSACTVAASLGRAVNRAAPAGH